MVTVIMTVCSVLRLTTSEARTEIMCQQTEHGGKMSLTITEAGQVYKQTVNFS